MTRKPSFLASFAILLFASLAWAELKVEPACRIRNLPPGRCGWCSLETLGRHHQIKALYGLAGDHATTCAAADLEAVLDEKHIRYRVQHAGELDQQILRDAIRNNLGAAVGFRELRPGAGGHIVTLIDFTSEGVKVVDSNDADGRIRQMSLDRFLYWWDGFALVLEIGPNPQLIAAGQAGVLLTGQK
jgi:hypothetical protein